MPGFATAAGDAMLNPIKALFRSRERPIRLVPLARRRTSLAPAVVLAAGAGAALWWWTQWARGETEDAASTTTGVDEPLAVTPVLATEAVRTLDENLGVQAASSGSHVGPGPTDGVRP